MPALDEWSHGAHHCLRSSRPLPPSPLSSWTISRERDSLQMSPPGRGGRSTKFRRHATRIKLPRFAAGNVRNRDTGFPHLWPSWMKLLFSPGRSLTGHVLGPWCLSQMRTQTSLGILGGLVCCTCLSSCGLKIQGGNGTSRFRSGIYCEWGNEKQVVFVWPLNRGSNLRHVQCLCPSELRPIASYFTVHHGPYYGCLCTSLCSKP